MKKVYKAPKMEIEYYSLDASIASNCANIVSNGPAVGNHQLCNDYEDPFAMSDESGIALFGGPYNVQFYEDTHCDCYYSSNDNGYWTS